MNSMLKSGKTNENDIKGLVTTDVKLYGRFGKTIAIAQIEESGLKPDPEQIKKSLNTECENKGYSYAVFNVVDLDSEESMVVFSDGITDREIKAIFGFETTDGYVKLKRILQRKTDFVLQIDEYYSIYKQLESGNCILVFGTNVLLSIYRYSPEFSEFALACLDVKLGDNVLSDYIVLPYTVFMEYKRHYKKEYSAMKKKFDSAHGSILNAIDNAKNKMLAPCNGLKNRQYVDLVELIKIIEDDTEKLRQDVSDYFEDRQANMELVANSWGNDDYVRNVVENIFNGNRIMKPFSQDELYDICDEGEQRYKKKIPPGFKDSGNETGKDGIRKYGDLILWKEIIRYCNENRKNVIFVTDDIKIDWWIEKKNGHMDFHSKLYDEFKKCTMDDNKMPLTIFPMTSLQLYESISDEWGLEKADIVELALVLTDEGYIEKVQESVLDEALSRITYSGEEYIDTDTAHIGSMGLDELIFNRGEFIEAYRSDRIDDEIIYDFTYEITMEGTSYDYWGRDGREIIPSPGINHIFKGELDVEVRRNADVFVDISDDMDYTDVKVTDCRLEEVKFSEGIESDYDEEIHIPDAYNVCPKCGRPINRENDAGTGFYIDCERDMEW